MTQPPTMSKNVLWVALACILGFGPAARLLNLALNPSWILALFGIGCLLLALVLNWRRMGRWRTVVTSSVAGLLIGLLLAIPVGIGLAMLVVTGRDRAMAQLPLILLGCLATPIVGLIAGLARGLNRAVAMAPPKPTPPSFPIAQAAAGERSFPNQAQAAAPKQPSGVQHSRPDPGEAQKQ